MDEMTSESRKSSLLFRLLVFLGFLGSIAALSLTLAAFVLDVLVVNGECLVDLGPQSRFILNAIEY